MELSFLTLDGLSHLLMPALNLSLFKMSLVIRLARAGTREVVHQDYMKFARAKGLSESRLIMVHLLKNIMIPVVTVLGLELGGLIAFSVVTETVFAWPGMGKLIIDSIHLLDRPVVVAYLMIIVLMFVVINLVVDVLYSILDPRVRLRTFKAEMSMKNPSLQDGAAEGLTAAETPFQRFVANYFESRVATVAFSFWW